MTLRNKGALLTRRRGAAVVLLLGLFSVALFLGIGPGGPTEAFGSFVCYPVPDSVRSIRYQDNGKLGLWLEPVVWMRFSAGKEDMKTIVRQRGGKLRLEENGVWRGRGMAPGWWNSFPLGEGERLYRLHGGPKSIVGKGAIEYLRIDATGTKAFYLLWGI